jgi:hypothetical protein
MGEATPQVVGGEVDHTEIWKDQFRVKPSSKGRLARLTFTGGGGDDYDRP